MDAFRYKIKHNNSSKKINQELKVSSLAVINNSSRDIPDAFAIEAITLLGLKLAKLLTLT